MIVSTHPTRRGSLSVFVLVGLFVEASRGKLDFILEDGLQRRTPEVGNRY